MRTNAPHHSAVLAVEPLGADVAQRVGSALRPGSGVKVTIRRAFDFSLGSGRWPHLGVQRGQQQGARQSVEQTRHRDQTVDRFAHAQPALLVPALGSGFGTLAVEAVHEPSPTRRS